VRITGATPVTLLGEAVSARPGDTPALVQIGTR
jgi:hypothetical protein